MGPRPPPTSPLTRSGSSIAGCGAPNLLSTPNRITWTLHPDNQGGLAFETETAPNPNPNGNSSGNSNATLTSNRHYLSAGGQVIGVLVSSGALPTLGANQTAPTVLASITLVKLEYWHKDHLGSLITTTDHLGSVTARYAYDPFGKRRQTSGTYDPFGALVVDWVNNRNAGTDRGFTGHEHLDDVGIVHMNGRLYDPNLGVMLQPDPFIQDPANLQNFNRYGYCFNNPLTCTDPSGFSFWTKIRGAVVRIAAAVADVYGCGGYCSAAAGAYYGSKNGGGLKGALIGGVSSYFAFQLGPMGTTNIGGGFGQAAIAGFFSGVAASGDLEGGLKGAFTAAVFFGAGELINGAYTDGFKLTQLEGVAVHAVAGCVTSVAGGGKCGPGALSAAFSKAATVYDITPKDVIGGTIVSAVIGGTASALGGGKFANGAATAAFGYIFNFLAHKRPVINPNGAGEDSAYAIDFERDMHAKELGLLGRALKWMGVDSLSLPLKVLGKGQDWTQDAICAVQTCYGSRDLSADIRTQALAIEPQVREMATNIATNNNWNLNYLSRDQLQTIVQGWSSIQNFTKIYGSTDAIMSRFPAPPKPPGQ